MIGRLFFIFAGIISFSCILFFGYQLTQNQHTISAELIFNNNDGKILIVNKLKETNPANISFSFPKNESQLIQKLFSTSYNSERVYIPEHSQEPLLTLRCAYCLLIRKLYALSLSLSLGICLFLLPHRLA